MTEWNGGRGWFRDEAGNWINPSAGGVSVNDRPVTGLTVPDGVVSGDGLTPGLRVAPMVVSDSGETPTVPIMTFVGPTNPVTIPALASLVISGAVWIDTSVGPPYEQSYASFFEGEFDGWQKVPLVGYDGAAYGVVSADAGGVALAVMDANGVRVATMSMPAARSGASFVVTFSDGEINNTQLFLQSGVVVLGDNSGPQFSIGPDGVAITGLPTSDPHSAGALWSNLGVLTVSAGA